MSGIVWRENGAPDMADPNPFDPGFSYSGYQANNPTKPLPGPQVDNDFANVQQSTVELADAIKDVRRSDGALQNGIVTHDSLSAEVLIGVPKPIAWAPGISYSTASTVYIADPNNAGIYRATADHVSSADFDTDRGAGLWELLLDLRIIAVPDNSITEPKYQTGSVSTRVLENGAVTTPKLDDGAVTRPKLSAYLTAQAIGFPTVAALLADNELSYSTAEVGSIIEAQGFRYEVAADDATDHHVETAGGVPLYLRRNADLVVHSEAAGITAATTSASDINAMLANALAAGARTVKMAKGEWAPDGQIVWPAGLKELDWQGSLVTQNSSVGAGEFALAYADSLEILPALSGDIDRTTTVVTFAAPHGLAVGDVIGFRNTTTSSLNAWRSTYYDGQQTIVREVVSATEVALWDMLDPRGALKTFPAASTEIVRYPATSRGLALRNLTMRGSTAPHGMVKLSGMTNFELENVDVTGGSYAALSLSLGAYGRSEGLRLGNFGAPAGTQYGLSHDAVSYHKTFGTVAYGTRHAIQHGNSDGVGSLPLRGNEHYGVALGASSLLALDSAHGNILDHRCIGGTVQGVALGGCGNTVDVDVITTSPNHLAGNVAVLCSEMHSPNHLVRARRVVVSGNGITAGSPSAVGILSMGGTSQALASQTVDGGVIEMDIGTIDARNWSHTGARFTSFRNRGFAGRWGVKLRIGQIVSPVEALWLYSDAMSGTSPVLLDVGTPPDRFDPSGSPTHGWNAATRGTGISAMAAGGYLDVPVMRGSVAHAGATIANGAQEYIFIAGFSGLTTRDVVSISASGTYGILFAVGVVVSSSQVRITVINLTGSSATLPPLTWYADVEKRP